MGKRRTTEAEKMALQSGGIQAIPLSKLRLDPENPRLPEQTKAKHPSQEQLLDMMVRRFSLEALGKSFADHGYFPQEPMVVVRPGNGTYTVVEGNRRLAALSLLTDARARRKLAEQDWFRDREWEEVASAASAQDLSTIPCFICDTRSELTSFLGFRHVSGIRGWEPVEKARFIHQLIEKDGMDFKQAARVIGSRLDFVRRTYVAYRIIVQAREELDIDPKRAIDRFGVFYRSLSTRGVRQFIGLAEAKPTPAQCKRPIRGAKGERLRELFSYMFGDPDHPAVMTDSRQLTELGAVLSSKPALENLRANCILSAAYELSEGEQNQLITYLERASFALDKALSSAHRHADSTAVQQRVERCCGSLKEIAKRFPHVYREYFKGESNA